MTVLVGAICFCLSALAVLFYRIGYTHWKTHVRCFACNKGIERDELTYRDRFGSNVPVCPHCGENRPGNINFDQVGRWAYGRWQWKTEEELGTFKMELNDRVENIHAIFARADGKLIAVRYRGGGTEEWRMPPGEIKHCPEPLEALAALGKTA